MGYAVSGVAIAEKARFSEWIRYGLRGMELVWQVASGEAKASQTPRERPLPKEFHLMALPFGDTSGPRDPRALAILAKTIYRELRSSGFEARDVLALASELLGQVTTEVRAAPAGSPPRAARART